MTKMLPQPDIREKLAGLVLNGAPAGIKGEAARQLRLFQSQLSETSCNGVKVVVFGGGSGLSNIIGGDSRRPGWQNLKDLDLIAIGDLRHVLLSSIQAERLQLRYQLPRGDVQSTAEALAQIFNFRFDTPLVAEDPSLQELEKEINSLPPALGSYMEQLMSFLQTDPTLSPMLQRAHCLGNLLIVAAIFQQKKTYNEDLHTALYKGLNALAFAIGAGERAVLPCTSTPAGLWVRYANGVEILGEHKLEKARRDVAIAGVKVSYCGEVKVYDEILQDIAEADIIICAPGSLYSSIIPVLQTPGIAEAVRNNKNALKMLVANIWVQEGETDLVSDKTNRRFYVSDLIEAYETNIPGGTANLFTEILSVSLQDIPASVLQRYAVEGKIPIYLDREKLIERGLIPVECDIYSTSLLQTRGIIQHDPLNLAKVVRSLFLGRRFYRQDKEEESSVTPPKKAEATITTMVTPHQRYQQIAARIENTRFLGDLSHSSLSPKKLKETIIDILWDNPVIPLSHLQYFSGVHLYPNRDWHREQKWDNVFSYFDPADNTLKIRQEELTSRQNIELAFFVALGESLLGDYAQSKKIVPMVVAGKTLGQVYLLRLRPLTERNCYFSEEELHTFLSLSRMSRVEGKPGHYSRLLNMNEGFTPPGLLMGLIYAWYIDNRLATHIEYKMSLLKIAPSALIPNQLHMAERRKKTISFFREVVFSGSRQK